MAEQPAGEKTEKPTPKRLREAREQGRIARTPELATWLALLATTVLLKITVDRGTKAMTQICDGMAQTIANPDLAAALRFATDAAWSAAGVIAPLLLGLMLVGLVANIAQVGFKPTAKKLKPDFSNLNPMKGFKRMFGMQSWWEVGKSILKTAILVVVAWPVVAGTVMDLTTKGGLSLLTVTSTVASAGMLLLRNVAAAGLVVAAADYTIQKRRLNKQLRMTRQELREELKQQEGSPEVKHAVRRRAMAISRNRMIGAVSAADVVVVNPTHYAVALRYDPTKGAPQMLAKGAGVLAAKIRREAEEHGIPIVHQPVLTRALYRTCEVGHLIPVDLYEAVAHLLAFVFGLRSKGRAQGYHDMPRPALL